MGYGVGGVKKKLLILYSYILSLGFNFRDMDLYATHLPMLGYIWDWYFRGVGARVLEFGCGESSTKFFVERGCDVTSIEMQDVLWHDRIKAMFPGVDMRLALGPDEWRKLALGNSYDFIFIDGHILTRPECLNWAFGKAPLVAAHDTQASCYGWERVMPVGYDILVFKSYGVTTTLFIEEGYRIK